MTHSPQTPLPDPVDVDFQPDRTQSQTARPQHAFRLLYRYGDARATVPVANRWDNASIEGTAARLVGGAALHELHAANLQRDPPQSVPPLLVRTIIDRHITRAIVYREAAKGLARERESFIACAQEYLAQLNG